MVTTNAASVRARTDLFYFWMAAACALYAWGAFSTTYWLQLAAGTFVGGTPLMHLHAGLFSAWTLLLMWQAWQAANGQLAQHRAWGLVGISLATAMVLVGLALARLSVLSFLSRGYGDQARGFLVLPAQGIGLFAIFFAAAVAKVRQADWHKRLMIVATVALLEAAAGRIGFLIATGGGGPGMRPGLGPPPPTMSSFQGALLVSPILIAGVLHDWRTRGRPHPAYVLGLVVTIGVGALGAWLSTTPGWMRFADAFVAFGQ